MLDRNSPTTELEARVEELWATNPYPSPEVFSRSFIRVFDKHCRTTFGKVPATPIFLRIADISESFYEAEGLCSIEFPGRFRSDDPIERGRYRDALLKLIEIGERQQPDAWITTFCERLLLIYDQFLKALPAAAMVDKLDLDAEYDDGAPAILLKMEDVGEVVDAMIVHSFTDYPNHHSIAFDALKQHLIEQGERVQGKGEPIMPDAYRGPPQEIVNRFLGEDSMLAALFHVPMPMLPPEPEEEPEPGEPVIDERSWYSHALLLAQPGAGKTNAIRWRITNLLPDIQAGNASLIVLDPKGVLTHEMLTLARTLGLEKRTIFIDPEHAPVSVNLFARDGSTNETIGRLARVLGTLTTDLTPMQRDTLTYALRALFALSGVPTLTTLRTVLRQGKAALEMNRLPAVVHEFFEYDFKEADGRFILSRLNSLLSNEIFETLFSEDRPSYDIGKDMQAGRLIVINAGSAESLYGRFWIEEIARTIKPRIAMQGRQLPTTLIIDEAPLFISEDRHFAEILDTAREARLGIFVAAQHMAQVKDPAVTNSLYNCQLKFVARTNADIHNLCRSMGMTEPDFLGTVPQYHFAFFGPNMQSAALVKLPLIEFPRARQEDIDFFRRSLLPARPITPQALAAPPPTFKPKLVVDNDFDTDWKG